MLDFPIGELITPEEQVAVARAVAIMASRDDQVSDSERHFVEELMGQMMLLPEERDQVRKEFSSPADLLEIAGQVKHREARIFLYYQAVCAAMADNKLVEGELDALLQLAEVFEFETDTAQVASSAGSRTASSSASAASRSSSRCEVLRARREGRVRPGLGSRSEPPNKALRERAGVTAYSGASWHASRSKTASLASRTGLR